MGRKFFICIFPVLFVAVCVACGSTAVPQGTATSQLPAERVLDMTYPFGDDSIYWPTGKSFESIQMFSGKTDAGFFYSSNDYSANEHGGTHVDAPIHFNEQGKTIDEIPLTTWFGPVVVIDVTRACEADRDYRLTVRDIQGFEEEHGPIPKGAWVVMYTGIGTQHYPDRKKVLGTDQTGPEAIPLLSFPGFSRESADYLLEHRDILGVAIDTPSIDYGKSTDFIVHQILLGAGKLAIENIAGLDNLPKTGATLYAVPMLIEKGSGAPARIFAVLPPPAAE